MLTVRSRKFTKRITKIISRSVLRKTAAFAVDSSHQSALDQCGLWPVLDIIHKEGLCPSNGDINSDDDVDIIVLCINFYLEKD
jgi:hypothetical protein